MIATTIPNNQRNSADLSALTNGRWFPSEYRDDSRPTFGFRLAAGLAVIAWLVITGIIVTRTSTVGSPDEAANRLMMRRLAQTGQYRIDSGVAAEALSFLHPRSLAVQGQFLASGSFLGLVQAGALVIKVAGVGAERFLTPLLSLAGLWAVFFTARRFWGRWWSLLTVILIALHPAFFEFATLPYLHNGAFVAGLMIACWGLLRLLERPSLWAAILSGATFGLVLFFRPVEALWTVPVLVIVLVARKLWRELLIVGLMTVAIQVPWLMANRAVFGSFLSSGYTPSGLFTDTVGAASITASAKALFTPPGGAWSWHWLSSAWWYFVLFLPAWSAMAMVAMIRYFRRKYVTWSKALKLTVLFLIGIFPLVYYGTWNLYPTTPASVNGALASYVRYWVPSLLMMVPGVIITLRLLSRRWLVLVVATVMAVSQAVIIWTQPVAGLSPRFSADKIHAGVKNFILQNTQTNAVIIAGSNDKYVQGDRLAGFRLPKTDAEWTTLKNLSAQRSTYLYAAVAQCDIVAVIADSQAHGLRLESFATNGRDGLYRFTLVL